MEVARGVGSQRLLRALARPGRSEVEHHIAGVADVRPQVSGPALPSTRLALLGRVVVLDLHGRLVGVDDSRSEHRVPHDRTIGSRSSPPDAPSHTASGARSRCPGGPGSRSGALGGGDRRTSNHDVGQEPRAGLALLDRTGRNVGHHHAPVLAVAGGRVLGPDDPITL